MASVGEHAGGSMALSKRYDSDILETIRVLKEQKDVEAALDFVKEQLPETIEFQKELVLIEAPTGHEENRARRYAQMLEQADQVGITVPFLSCDGFSNPDIYALAGDFTDGVIYVAPAPAKESDLHTKFVSEYEAAFNMSPDSFATNAYDATNIIIEAMRSAGTDRAAVRDEIAATKDFVGASGVINFAPNGDLVAYQAIYKVEGTTPVYQGSYSVDADGNLVQVD